MMKIWIQRDRTMLFKVNSSCYAQLRNIITRNKRLKIKEVDVISLASSLSSTYPPDFRPTYFSEDIRYWHELRDFIKI